MPRKQRPIICPEDANSSHRQQNSAPPRRLFHRPLVKLTITLCLNVALLIAIATYGIVQRRRVAIDISLFGTLSYFFADANGVYIGLLPPQKGISGTGYR